MGDPFPISTPFQFKLPCVTVGSTDIGRAGTVHVPVDGPFQLSGLKWCLHQHVFNMNATRTSSGKAGSDQEQDETTVLISEESRNSNSNDNNIDICETAKVAR